MTTSDTDPVFHLLLQGKEDDARKQLKLLLTRDPMSATAQLLSDSITRDPVELLGPTSNAYTVQAGDTPVSLAEHFLGNRLKAYQLIRYNRLVAPVTLMPGQVLRVPGDPVRVDPVRRPETVTPRSAPNQAVNPAPKPKPAAKPAVSPQPTSNPAGASAARAAGLAALNGGKVNQAVALLRRAAAMDRGNPAIARDLARAERIAATVRSHQ